MISAEYDVQSIYHTFTGLHDRILLLISIREKLFAAFFNNVALYQTYWNLYTHTKDFGYSITY